MAKVCLHAGRNPMRRKKNCVWILLGILGAYGLVQMTFYNDRYSPLRPLVSAESEAKRLLKFITHYHYQCNATVQVGNRSHFPICVEKDAGVDLDSKDTKIMYSIGPTWDFLVERSLALNHTFQVYIASHEQMPLFLRDTNNTHVQKTVIVANDYADFTRNAYGQQTINNLMQSLGHQSIDLLKLEQTAENAQLWEIIHFMIADNLFLDVKQLHIAMYIDKIEEDYLYNWYRALYELFYKQGFRLYHTASADSLCLQVTMMQSCVYYMSWVHNPGPKVFVLHPPADYGTEALEEERLLDYITSPQVECKQQVIGGPNEQNLQFTTPGQPTWKVCSSGVYELFRKPCSIIRFRSANDHVLEQKFIKEGCSVHTFEPVLYPRQPLHAYKMHSHYPHRRKKGQRSIVKSSDDVFQWLNHQGRISLLEVDISGHEWQVLGQILDSGVLPNVTQVVAQVQIADRDRGKHPTVLRSRYSELQRLASQGFKLFHSSTASHMRFDSRRRGILDETCCFKLGFVRKEVYR